MIIAYKLEVKGFSNGARENDYRVSYIVKRKKHAYFTGTK